MQSIGLKLRLKLKLVYGTTALAWQVSETAPRAAVLSDAYLWSLSETSLNRIMHADTIGICNIRYHIIINAAK